METTIMKVGTDIYPGYKALTYEDAAAAEKVNAINGWGITYSMLMALIKTHEKARNVGNIRYMERVEYMLTDANFHREARLLKEGEYDALREIAFKEFLA